MIMLTDVQVAQVRHIVRLEHLSAAVAAVANAEETVYRTVVTAMQDGEETAVTIQYFDRSGSELGGMAL